MLLKAFAWPMGLCLLLIIDLIEVGRHTFDPNANGLFGKGLCNVSGLIYLTLVGSRM